MTERDASDIAAVLHRETAHLPDGVQLPGELQLAQRFGVPRARVRSAIDSLVRRHLLRRVRGGGTFTNRPLEIAISHTRPPSFHDAVQAAGHRPTTAVVDTREVPAPPPVAQALGRDPGRPVLRLTRLGWVDERIARCGYEWILPGVIPEPQVALSVVDSVSELLRMGSHTPQRGRTVVCAEEPPPEVAKLLELPAPTATWMIETLSLEADTREPIMLSRAWSRQDVIRIVIEW